MIRLFKGKPPVPKPAPRKRVSKPKIAPELEQYGQELLAHAMEKYPVGYEPEIEWKRLPVTAGVAYFQLGKIALSAVVLQSKEQLHETLLHEYAHLLAYHRAGKKGVGHGAVWKQAMRDLGLDPKVHHHFEVQRNQARQQVIYHCKKCGQTFSRSRRLSKRRQYLHVACGGPIQLHSVVPVMGDKEISLTQSA